MVHNRIAIRPPAQRGNYGLYMHTSSIGSRPTVARSTDQLGRQHTEEPNDSLTAN